MTASKFSSTDRHSPGLPSLASSSAANSAANWAVNWAVNPSASLLSFLPASQRHRHSSFLLAVAGSILCLSGAVSGSLFCGVGISNAYAGNSDGEPVSDVGSVHAPDLIDARRAWIWSRTQHDASRPFISRGHVAGTQSMPTRSSVLRSSGIVAANASSGQVPELARGAAPEPAPEQALLTAPAAPTAPAAAPVVSSVSRSQVANRRHDRFFEFCFLGNN